MPVDDALRGKCRVGARTIGLQKCRDDTLRERYGKHQVELNIVLLASRGLCNGAWPVHAMSPSLWDVFRATRHDDAHRDAIK